MTKEDEMRRMSEKIFWLERRPLLRAKWYCCNNRDLELFTKNFKHIIRISSPEIFARNIWSEIFCSQNFYRQDNSAKNFFPNNFKSQKNFFERIFDSRNLFCENI